VKVKFDDVQRSKIDRRTAEMGHQRHFERALAASDVHPGADISLQRTNRRGGPQASILSSVLLKVGHRSAGWCEQQRS
jgi:hypothetical protein